MLRCPEHISQCASLYLRQVLMQLTESLADAASASRLETPSGQVSAPPCTISCRQLCIVRSVRLLDFAHYVADRMFLHLTEPDSGSDAFALRSTAKKESDGYVLVSSLIWNDLQLLYWLLTYFCVGLTERQQMLDHQRRRSLRLPHLRKHGPLQRLQRHLVLLG